jgi:hypothetical protein
MSFFSKILEKLGLKKAPAGTTTSTGTTGGCG